MTRPLTADAEAYLRAFGPAPDDVVREMEAYGDEHGPSSVGRDLGRWLRLFTVMTGASRVFEVGSAYGYSAYWFASGLPEDGEVVLTDTDADRLDRARGFLKDAGLDYKATFVAGDAIETLERTDGGFDIVLVDVPKSLYPRAFEVARDRVAPGGLLLADNAMVSTSIDFDALVAALDGEEPVDGNESTRGMATYLRRARADPAFETAVLPLGEGLAVSHKRADG